MNHLDEVRQLLEQSGRMVFFGGAGTSTESGIPDFRSETGLYRISGGEEVSPETILSRSFFIRQTEDFYRFYKDKMIYADAKPNAAHLALARLEQEGRLTSVITQNIDGLHQAAGSRSVWELHGSIHRNHCMNCHESYDLDYVLKNEEIIPKCAVCRGKLKPDVVLYEEALDERVLMGAMDAIAGADLLIVGGTSLSVYPAAGLIRYFAGDRLVIINRTPTPFDDSADYVIHDSIGRVFAELK
ncbi:NAD-dependent protein deacylase [Paenibacillus sp. J2TS4]|uniref:NAD-dependent protein deacylase n=1 Tax=Paenibacillus sp. J2TS4 TaxID=2807194 RepID=UPI001B2B7011|nr:NAD-dependent protein deacylase [Paenibacillus sp. J2TS4]GIP31609.1 NAD-dependent protein deacetylase [Paenibacillus sp. J2TS4]